MVKKMILIGIKNIQAIKEATFNFGDNGVTEFVGDNSNGKSIIAKFIEYLVSGDIADKSVRADLINDEESEGSVLIQWNNKRLYVVLRRERKDCFVSLHRDYTKGDEPGNIIRRGLDDKGYLELLNEFGFRTYNNGDICLQVAPTYGAIPFVTTKGATNAEIVDAISTDVMAEEFLTAFEGITTPAFKLRLHTLNSQKQQLETLISNCKVGNYERFRQLSVDMGVILQAVKSYKPVTIENLPIPPMVDIIDIPNIVINNLPLFKFGPIKSEVSMLSDELHDLTEYFNGKCPTCGRLLCED